MNIDNLKVLIKSNDIDSRKLALGIIRQDESLYKYIKEFKVIDRIFGIEDIYWELRVKEEDIIPYRYPKNKKQLSQNAFAKLQCVSEVLNEGVVLDFNKSDQHKYFPYFRKTASGWRVRAVSYDVGVYAHLGSGLYFKDKETALFAGNMFLDIYIDYLPE